MSINMITSIRQSIQNNQNIIPVIGFEILPIYENGKTFQYLDYLSNFIIQERETQIKERRNQILEDADLQELRPINPIPKGEGGFFYFNRVVHNLLIANEFDRMETLEEVARCAQRIHSLVDTSYLEKIVRIMPFKYFLNLTFTNHLSEMVEKYRSFQKQPVIQSSFPFFSVNSNRPEDLKKNNCSFEGIVYNLWGAAYDKYKGVLFNYYCTDDHVLEFTTEFSKRYDSSELKNYKEIIQSASLLFLGFQYPDWLNRILINTLKPGSLSLADKKQSRIFFDYCNDQSTSLFLNKHKIKYEPNVDTLHLVSELYDNNSDLLINSSSGSHVFISYSSDNYDIVQKIVCKLALFGVKVWFDKVNLEPGGFINDEIKSAIESCKYFVPIITKEAIQKTSTGYVRQEWSFYRDYVSNLNKNPDTESKVNIPKLIPLVNDQLVFGALSFSIDEEFGRIGSNIKTIPFDDSGLDDQYIKFLK